MIVLDASAAFELVVRSASGRLAVVRIGDEAIHAPELLDVEVLSALRRAVFQHKLDVTAADRAVATLRVLHVQRWSSAPFAARIWALRDNASAYDAAYLALAEHLGCPLLTGDERLTRSHGHAAVVESIAEQAPTSR